MILYAPIIEPNVPAFTGNTLKVRFQHNIAVDEKDVAKIYCQIKNYNDNQLIETVSAEVEPAELTKGEVNFDLETITKPLIAGNFYKIQIAYANDIDDSVGPYSTVGITRWLGENENITLQITGLNTGELNPHRIEYVGTYEYDKAGLSEPVYQYKFELFAESDTILVETSGWLLPKRVNEEKIMNYTFENNLDSYINYRLCFTVLTVNGYSNSISYEVVKTGLLPIEFEGTLIATQEPEAKENGYVHIYIGSGELVSGVFRLIRQEDHSNTWDELTRFNMQQEDQITQFSWKDYSVEQGRSYTYGIQQCGKTSEDIPYYSTIVKADPLTEVEFEHMFLGDDKYQLKLAFNPQISTFKEAVLESKTDVIGGQYPFFFRNGKVRYKEIPISGLLSYLLDDEGYFLNTLNVVPASLGTGSTAARSQTNSGDIKPAEGFIRTTNLVNHNFASERQFKLAVLNWLNNGKPKLFRSPAEGNYVLRLMNISMSPNQQVGRMLHTVSATGYEVMEATPKKMLSEKIMSFTQVGDAVEAGAATNFQDGEYAIEEYAYGTPYTPIIWLYLYALQVVNDSEEETGTITIGSTEPITVDPGKTKTYYFDSGDWMSPPETIDINGTGINYKIYGLRKIDTETEE